MRDEVASWVRAVGPDPLLVEALLEAALSGRLSAAGRVDALAALEQADAMLEAAKIRVLAEMAVADAESDPTGRQWAREDVAAALRISPRTAANRMALAETVASRFPAMLRLLGQGRATLMHARKLDELTINLDADTASRVEAAVLDAAQRETVGEFAKTAQRAVLRVDAASAEQRHELARKDRRVSVQPMSDGMAELFWRLPAEEAVEVCHRVEAATARPHPGDPRTADQRRSDALFNLITAPRDNDASLAEPRLHGLRPRIQVTVPLTVLSGDSDGPGELAGHGPIPAELARRIAADPSSTWRRLVTDARGVLLDYGRTTYRPPADLTRTVIARDQTCCFPGCARPATRCELDHCRDWADGGSTDARNLHALCPRHHHLKHDTGWRYHDLPNGDIAWASPTGHTYIRSAKTYPDDFYFGEPPRRSKAPPQCPPLPDDPPF